MLTTTIFPGRYVQGSDALQALGEEVQRFSRRALFLIDPSVMENVLPSFEGVLEETLDYRVERFKGECSDEEIERVDQVVRDGGWEVVVGVGG